MSETDSPSAGDENLTSENLTSELTCPALSLKINGRAWGTGRVASALVLAETESTRTRSSTIENARASRAPDPGSGNKGGSCAASQELCERQRCDDETDSVRDAVLRGGE